MRKIWICGATGFCGTGVIKTILSENHVLTALEAQTDHVLAHIRKNSPHADAFKSIADWEHALQCNELEILEKAWTEIDEPFLNYQADIVFCALGITQKTGKKEGVSYQDIDQKLTLQMLNLSQKLPKAPVFVYVSSMGIEWHPWSSYLKARYEVEQAIIHSGLPYIILRPGFLTGPSRSDFRPAEKIGGWITNHLSNVFSVTGLKQAEDKSRPVSAEIMGGAVYQLLKTADKNHQLIIESAQIHQKYREFAQR